MSKSVQNRSLHGKKTEPSSLPTVFFKTYKLLVRMPSQPFFFEVVFYCRLINNVRQYLKPRKFFTFESLSIRFFPYKNKILPNLQSDTMLLPVRVLFVRSMFSLSIIIIFSLG